MHWAVEDEKPGLAALLVKSGADVNAANAVSNCEVVLSPMSWKSYRKALPLCIRVLCCTAAVPLIVKESTGITALRKGLRLS